MTRATAKASVRSLAQPRRRSGVHHRHTIGSVTDLEAAWNEFHDAKPDGWFVGTPVYIERRGWEQYAFDTRERAKHGRRAREWTAVGASEVEVVREMGRCLELISEGRWPE